MEDIYPLRRKPNAVAEFERKPGLVCMCCRMVSHRRCAGCGAGGLAGVVGRHTILRTAFAWRAMHPLQIVYEQVDPLGEQDWRGLPEAEQAERLESLLAAERMRGCAARRRWRAPAVRVEEASYQFVWQCHTCSPTAEPIAVSGGFALYTDPRQALSRPGLIAITSPGWLGRMDEAQAFWRARLTGNGRGCRAAVRERSGCLPIPGATRRKP